MESTNTPAIKATEKTLRALFAKMQQEKHAPKVAVGLKLTNSDGSFQVSSIEMRFRAWSEGYRAALATPAIQAAAPILTFQQRMNDCPDFKGVRSKEHMFDYALAEIADLRAALAAVPSQQPVEQRWTCFHCKESFNDPEQAALHFGKSERENPACSFDVAAFRQMEARVRECAKEDSDLHRAVYAMQSKHATDLLREEEKGYARGLKDAMAEWAIDPKKRHAVRVLRQIAALNPKNYSHNECAVFIALECLKTMGLVRVDPSDQQLYEIASKHMYDIGGSKAVNYLTFARELMGNADNLEKTLTGERRAAIHAKILARGDEDHMIGPAFAAPAAPVAPDLASPYQVRYHAGSGWRDATEAAYHTFSEKNRRIIPLAHSAQAPVEPVSALTDEQIAGIMGWRGPGAYTAATLRKIRDVLAASPKVDPVSEDKRDAALWRRWSPYLQRTLKRLPFDLAKDLAAFTPTKEST